MSLDEDGGEINGCKRCQNHNFETPLVYDKLRHVSQVKHGTFLRGDTPPSLNLIKKHLDIDTLISAQQVHGDHVVEVSSSLADPPQCDGLMTNVPGVGLVIKHADCQAAIFYDPVNQAIANIHCGWRGSVKNIYRETILKMSDRYGSCPENLIVTISPSLGPCHAEFINHKKELPQSFQDFQVKPNFFDFWQISLWQLKALGVNKENIEIAKQCTYADEEKYYSYRRDHTSDRLMTAIVIKELSITC